MKGRDVSPTENECGSEEEKIIYIQKKKCQETPVLIDRYALVREMVHDARAQWKWESVETEFVQKS